MRGHQRPLRSPQRAAAPHHPAGQRSGSLLCSVVLCFASLEVAPGLPCCVLRPRQSLCLARTGLLLTFRLGQTRLPQRWFLAVLCQCPALQDGPVTVELPQIPEIISWGLARATLVYDVAVAASPRAAGDVCLSCSGGAGNAFVCDHCITRVSPPCIQACRRHWSSGSAFHLIRRSSWVQIPGKPTRSETWTATSSPLPLCLLAHD
jgi:hypothetical protein